MSVTPRGMSIQEAYREYRNGNFRVNRTYQRKLVWTSDEKRALVDSVLRGYPIPLILLAYRTRRDGTKRFEILDGMQRLNALFSFIENGFDFEGRFFDVEQLSRARQLATEGLFQAVSDTGKLLSPDECANFLDYTLAVTEFPATNEDAVKDVFGRINSYGRQLSPQERRQAGVTTSFAKVIRELAAEIRGDASRDSLDLADMPSISVDLAGESSIYGIKADETFWCKQGILRRAQLRDSEDEQMLADVAISILENEPFAFSGKALDQRYDVNSVEAAALESKLLVYGTTTLKHEIRATFSVLRDVIEQVDSSPNALRKVVHPTSGANPIKTAFFAVFLAFFDLCVRKRKSPDDAHRILKAINGLQVKLHIAAGQIRTDPRRQNIDLTKGLIQDFFNDREPPAVLHSSGAAMAFENAVRRSKVETAAFECKQGLVVLSEPRVEQTGLLDRLVETACGIANIGPDSDGAIFVGLADSHADAKRIEQLDSIDAVPVGSRYCVGIERELPYLNLDLEGYKQKIVRHFSGSQLSEPLRTQLLGKIDCITYRGLSIVCVWIPAQSHASTVDDKIFVREGSNTLLVEGFARTQAVAESFSKTSSASVDSR